MRSVTAHMLLDSFNLGFNNDISSCSLGNLVARSMDLTSRPAVRANQWLPSSGTNVTRRSPRDQARPVRAGLA